MEIPAGTRPTTETVSIRHADENLGRLKQLNTIIGEYKASLISATDYLLRGRESFGAEKALLPVTADEDGERVKIREHALFLAKLKEEDKTGLEQKKQNSEREIYRWYQKEFPGVINLLQSYLPADPGESEIATVIAAGVANYTAVEGSLAKAYRFSVQDENGSVRFRTSRIEQVQLKNLTDLLLNRSTFFSPLNKVVSFEGAGRPINEPRAQDQTVETIIERAILTGLRTEAIQNLDQNTALEKLRDWVRETADKARRQGLKIFLTPFYKQILERGEFISRKRNGVGGVIYYGPPGTGKTEMHRAENANQGFDTKVINIHYYIGFAELMAEKAVSVAKNHGGDMAKGLSEVINQLKGESNDEFARNCHSLFDQLIKDGKLGADANFGQFIAQFITSEEQKSQLQTGDSSNPDWGTIRSEFINTTQARLLRTALPSAYQESVEEIVLGEILEAIEESKQPGGKRVRVVLDELDKAGPNSLGGLLSFLAKSPGEVFEYGGKKIVIPKWFKIGATSNEVTLREDLKSRFHAERVDMPPPKDQLMITAVHLSDGEGNILLSNEEQNQLAGFFVYVLPQLNKILVSYDFPPYSNRDVQRLCGDLVDVGRLERTTTTVSEALSNMVLKEKILSKIKKDTGETINAQEDVDECFYSLHSFFAERTGDLREKKEERVIENPLLAKKAGTAYVATEQRTLSDQPLFRTIAGLEGSVEITRKPKFHSINLTVEEASLIEKRLSSFGIRRVNAGPGLNIIKLPTGLALTSARDNSGLTLRLESAQGERLSHNPKTRQLFGQILGIDGEIIASSNTGDTIGILQYGQDKAWLRVAYLGGGGYKTHFCWNEKLANKNDSDQPVLAVSRNSKIEIDAGGSLISILDKDSNQLTIYGRSPAPWKRLNGVEDMMISPDGRLLMTESKDINGQILTTVYSTTLFSAEQILPGRGWRFAMDNLMVQEDNTGGTKRVKNQAILISN